MNKGGLTVNEVVVVSACRTAVARRKGALTSIRSDELLSIVLQDLVNRVNVDKGEVEDVIAGCVTQIEEQAMNIARTASLIAGFPIDVPGVTIDRQCGSSQQAVHFASQAILSGDMEVVIAAGVESMTRATMFANLSKTEHSDLLRNQYHIVNQGISAELIADKWGFSRERLDQYALNSHQKAVHAQGEGHFVKEITSVPLPGGGDFFIDEGPREDTSLEALAQLKPVFKENGKVTAGNASQMSDGASAVLLMSRKKAESLGLKPLAKIVARAVVGSDPTLMLTGPIAATRQVLDKAGLMLEDIDKYEVNEAFASVPLAWAEELGADFNKLNVNGGAIALGHPLGATGTKLLTSLMYELQRSKERYSLLAICEGMGMANATIIESL